MQPWPVASTPWPDHNPFRLAASRLKTTGDLARYRDDPVGFVRDILGEQPWSIQERILRELWEHRRVAAPACYDSGKSWTAARAVMAWVATDPEAIAVTTAPKKEQVEKILWGEVRKAWKPELPGMLAPKAPSWWVTASNWAEGMTTNSPERIQGFHEGRVLVVIDEAPGVDATIYEAIEGLLASHDVAVLLIGNPVEAAGPFYERATSPLWRTIHISAFDTPNLVAGQVVNPKLITRRWVDERKAEWGEDSPLYQSKVLGVFPDAGDINVIPLSWFERSLGRISPANPDPVVAGLDIARYGADDSAILIRQGWRVLHLERKHGASGPEVGGWAAALCRRYNVAYTNGDATGLGGPVLDAMRDQGLVVNDVHAGETPHDGETYQYARDEMWFVLRDRFRKDEISLFERSAGYPDGLDGQEVAKLRSQLTAIRYRYMGSGRLHVESKDELRKRGVPSPDLGDAACLAFYQASSALDYLSRLAPACGACGTPNRRGSATCRRCGETLPEET